MDKFDADLDYHGTNVEEGMGQSMETLIHLDPPTSEDIEELRVGEQVSLETIRSLFPKNNMIQNHYQSIRVTNVGLYSMTRREESYFITNLILHSSLRNQNRMVEIVDATSGIGGNTISFALHPNVKKVISIEANPLHAEILAHNVKCYGYANKVEVMSNHMMAVLPGLKDSDVIFYDPPWGGTEYRQQSMIQLGLYDSGKWGEGKWWSMHEIVNRFRTQTKLQVVKVPVNFAFQEFFQKIDFVKMRVHKVYNRYTKKLYYYLILLFS